MRTPAPKPRVAAERQVRKPAKPVVEPALEVSKKENKPFDSKGLTATVKLDLIHPNPDQPRTNFKPGEIEELAGSIKKEGLLQPILVRKIGNQYQILAGERRYRAARAWVWKRFPFVSGKPTTTKPLNLL